MTLDEAKKIATDPTRFSLHTVVGHALTVLAAALGEPSDADREAAAWHTAEACRNRNDGFGRRMRMHDRAAAALLRSPAAIRRAALEEAATELRHMQLQYEALARTDQQSIVPGGYSFLARVVGDTIVRVRALDGGAL